MHDIPTMATSPVPVPVPAPKPEPEPISFPELVDAAALKSRSHVRHVGQSIQRGTAGALQPFDAQNDVAAGADHLVISDNGETIGSRVDQEAALQRQAQTQGSVEPVEYLHGAEPARQGRGAAH